MQVFPVFKEVKGDCSIKAIVKTMNVDKERPSATTRIQAVDDRTGHRLQCEVRVSMISSLEVETTIRKLHIHNTETAYLEAFDLEGNKFSSIEGLRFKWTSQATDFVKIGMHVVSAVVIHFHFSIRPYNHSIHTSPLSSRSCLSALPVTNFTSLL